MEIKIQVKEVKIALTKVNAAIVISLLRRRWPMDTMLAVAIKKIVIRIQRLICAAALFDITLCENLQKEFLCALVNRVFAVNCVVQNEARRIFGFYEPVSLRVWKFDVLHKLRWRSLQKYSSFKKSNSSLTNCFAILYNKALQMLFTITLLPRLEGILGLRAGGFKSYWKVQTAVGRIVRLLSSTEIRGGFNVVTFDFKNFAKWKSYQWLVAHFPIPRECKFIFYQQLQAGLWKLVRFQFLGIPMYPTVYQEGSFGLLIAIFVLADLEKILLVSGNPRRPIASQSALLSSGLSRRQTSVAKLVKYMDNVFIYCSSLSEKTRVLKRFKEFLSKRGLCLDSRGFSTYAIRYGFSFHYLGFTFGVSSRRTAKTINYGTVLGQDFGGTRVRVYAIPCKLTAVELKNKLKVILRRVHKSVSQIILDLNSLLWTWGMYFTVSGGSNYKIFSSVDNFVHLRIWKFLKKKFPKTKKSQLAAHYFLGGASSNITKKVEIPFFLCKKLFMWIFLNKTLFFQVQRGLVLGRRKWQCRAFFGEVNAFPLCKKRHHRTVWLLSLTRLRSVWASRRGD